MHPIAPINLRMARDGLAENSCLNVAPLAFSQFNRVSGLAHQFVLAVSDLTQCLGYRRLLRRLAPEKLRGDGFCIGLTNWFAPYDRLRRLHQKWIVNSHSKFFSYILIYFQADHVTARSFGSLKFSGGFYDVYENTFADPASQSSPS